MMRHIFEADPAAEGGDRMVGRWRVLVIVAALLTGCTATQEAPTSTPAATSRSAAVQGAEAQVIELVAEDALFTTDRLEAVARVPIVIAFDNRDRLRHNVQVWDEGRTEKLFFGELVGGPTVIEYEIGELVPGEYRFECHPHAQTMFGTLVVSEGAAN
jgi:plastocyanin